MQIGHPVPEVQLDHVDAPRYIVLYTHAGKTHSVGVVCINDTCTVFFRNVKFEVSQLEFKHICINAADAATIVDFMFEPVVFDRMYDLSPLLNMTCI